VRRHGDEEHLVIGRVLPHPSGECQLLARHLCDDLMTSALRTTLKRVHHPIRVCDTAQYCGGLVGARPEG
jgi:hypothetical protein